jgi:hypothetical protein
MTTENDFNSGESEFDGNTKYKLLKFFGSCSLQESHIRIIREIFQTLIEQRDAVIKSEFDTKINSMNAMSTAAKADFKTKLLETSHLVDSKFKDKIRHTESKLLQKIELEFGKLQKLVMWAFGIVAPMIFLIIMYLITGPKK